MSLLEQLDKAQKELDWKVIQSRRNFIYDYEAEDLRRLVVNAAKEIQKLNEAKLDSFGVK